MLPTQCDMNTFVTRCLSANYSFRALKNTTIINFTTNTSTTTTTTTTVFGGGKTTVKVKVNVDLYSDSS